MGAEIKKLPCRHCENGKLNPIYYNCLIVRLQCDTCGRNEITSDMNRYEYLQIVEEYYNKLNKED